MKRGSTLSHSILTAALFMAIILQGCGNTGTQNGTFSATGAGGSSSAQPGSQVLILPDGSALLPDGTRVRTSSQTLTVAPNRLGTTVVTASGPTSLDSLGLQVHSTHAARRGIVQSTMSRHAPHVHRLVLNHQGIDQGAFTHHLVATALPGHPCVGRLISSVTSKAMIKASYVQLDAVGSLSIMDPKNWTGG